MVFRVCQVLRLRKLVCTFIGVLANSRPSPPNIAWPLRKTLNDFKGCDATFWQGSLCDCTE